MLNKIEVQEINYLADTVIYDRAIELSAGKLNFKITKSRLNKLLLFIDNSNQGYSDDRGMGTIVNYLSHQLEKDTLNSNEQAFYQELHTYIEKEVICNNEVFSGCIRHKGDSKKIKWEKRKKSDLISDLLLKQFLICLINDMRLKGENSG